MAGNAAQVHPVHIQLDGFLTHFFGIDPRFRFWRVLDLAEYAAVLMAATRFFRLGSAVRFGDILDIPSCPLLSPFVSHSQIVPISFTP